MRRMSATIEKTPMTVDTVDMTRICRLFNPTTTFINYCMSIE